MTRRPLKEHRGRRHDEPRTAVVPPVRVTVAELDQLRGIAADWGLSLSDLVRSIPMLHAVAANAVIGAARKAKTDAATLYDTWEQWREAGR